jgi:hypothetical protein
MSRREFGLRKKPRTPTVLDLLHRSSNNRRNRLKNISLDPKPISTPATDFPLLNSTTFTNNAQLIELDTTPAIPSTDSTNNDPPTSSVPDPTSIPTTVPRQLSSTTFTSNTLLLDLDTTPTITSTDSAYVEQSTSSVLNPISPPATIPRLQNNNTFKINTLLVDLDTTPTITPTASTNTELPTFAEPDLILAHIDHVSTTSVNDTITTHTQLITHDTTPTFTVTDPAFTTVELTSSSPPDFIPATFTNVSTSTVPSTTPLLIETFPLTVPATSNKNWTNMDTSLSSYNDSENANVTDTIHPRISLETRLALQGALGIVFSGYYCFS